MEHYCIAVSLWAIIYFVMHVLYHRNAFESCNIFIYHFAHPYFEINWLVESDLANKMRDNIDYLV